MNQQSPGLTKDPKKIRDLSPTEIAEFRAAIANNLRRHPGSAAKEIRQSLGVHRTTVNSVLYASRELFTHGGEDPPLWRLVGDGGTGPAPPDSQLEEQTKVRLNDNEVPRSEMVLMVERDLRAHGPSSVEAIAERLQLPIESVSRSLYRFPGRFNLHPSDSGNWSLT